MAVDIERACEVMHDAYEKAALGVGWETNPQSRVPWSAVPEANKETMRAAVAALIEWIREGEGPDGDRQVAFPATLVPKASVRIVHGGPDDE